MICCCDAAPGQDVVMVNVGAEAAAGNEKTEPEVPKVEEEEPAPEPAKPEEPPAPEPVPEVLPRSFEAEVKRLEGKKFGSQCVKWSEYVEIAKVAPDGDLEEYNKSVAEDARVKSGDFIGKVKSVGQSDDDVRQQKPQAMVDVMKKGGDLKVTVVKPFRFDVEVSKDGGLGLQLQYTDTCAGIVVLELKDGPFKAYNDALSSDRSERVKANDCIEFVNGGKANSGAELADRIKSIEKGTQVKMGFIRFTNA